MGHVQGNGLSWFEFESHLGVSKCSFRSAYLVLHDQKMYSTGPHSPWRQMEKRIKSKTHFELKGNALSQPGTNIVLTVFSCMFSGASKYVFSILILEGAFPLTVTCSLQSHCNTSLWEFPETRCTQSSVL